MTSSANNSNLNLLLNIKQQNNIIDVIQEHLTLSRKGNNFVGICPFHDDRHPSLVVNEKKQIFKCFSCDTAGDVIRFVSLFQKIKF